MKKRKLKGFVLPTLYLIITLSIFVGVVLLGSSADLQEKDYDYGTEVVEKNEEPVLNEDDEASNLIASPINENTANLSIHFYSKDAEEVTQQNSLIYYENTYLPNTGILYSSDTDFDVLAVFDGKVTDILDDEFFGKVVVVEHSSNLRTYYYGLKDILVNVNDEISTNAVLGTSNNNEIMNDKKTFLLEVYYNNELINPETFIGNKITEFN